MQFNGGGVGEMLIASAHLEEKRGPEIHLRYQLRSSDSSELNIGYRSSINVPKLRMSQIQYLMNQIINLN